MDCGTLCPSPVSFALIIYVEFQIIPQKAFFIFF